MVPYVLKATIASITVALPLGCSIDSKRRAASSLAMTSSSPALLSALPTGLKDGSTDASPAACTSCGTVGAALKPLLHHRDYGLVQALTSADNRLSALMTRVKDHYVPCLEGGTTLVTRGITTDITLSAQVNCFLSYGQGPYNDYYQFVFGHQTGGVETRMERRGVVDSNVSLSWLKVAPTGDIDLWYGQDTSQRNGGSMLSHLNTTGQTGEWTTAGRNQFTLQNALMCGVHLRWNSSKIFVKGKFISFSSTGAQVAISCTDVTEASFCLSATDLTDLGLSACSDINTFSLPSLAPSHMNEASWGKRLNIDVSETVARFKMEGLEIQ